MTHETLSVPAAPVLPENEPGQNALSNLLPLTGVLGSMAMVVGMGPGGSAGRGLLMAGALLVSTCAMVGAQIARQRLQRRRTVERAREEHLHRLDVLARQLREKASARRSASALLWPGPTDAATPSSRSLVLPHTLDVRFGTCEVEHDVQFVREEGGPGVADPVCADALDRFADAHGHVQNMPFTIDLDQVRRFVLLGTAVHLEAAVRALMLSCGRAHGPERVALALLCAPDELPRWDWLKWLPHTMGHSADLHAPRLVEHRTSHLLARAGTGRHLVVVTTPEWARLNPELVADELPERHTVVALHTDPPTPTDTFGSMQVTIAPAAAQPGINTRPAVMAAISPAPVGTRDLRPDLCSLAEATAAARSLAARDANASDQTSSGRAVDVWTDAAPRPRAGAELLRVEIGTDMHGAALHLDLKEAAHDGHGPHGLLVGATGSGKSELLRTLVTALVSTHVPEDLAVILVDFKGGATFAELAHLPHVAACVTNLCDDASLVDRMQDALAGEMERRQELLHSTGHASVSAYRASRAAGVPLEPMPHLFICVDEFSELLAARPEFVDLFTAIGRLGRSLGLHLLLASQRLDDGRLHALEAHLSYRIALRTFSAQESRTVIGAPDAHTLPRRPGVGLVRMGADDLVRFDAHHLDTPAPGLRTNIAGLMRPVLFTAAGHRGRTGRVATPALTAATPSTGDLLTARLMEEAPLLPRTRQVWLPPLAAPVTLGDLIGPLATNRERGLHSPQWSAVNELRVPLGVVDLPRQQRHELLGLTLDGARGHVAVVGAPRAGRSTGVQTLLCALALARTPSELTVHLVDLAGGALAPLAGLPHVISHVQRGQNSLLERVVADAEATVAARETSPDGPTPRLLVVIDGWGTLRSDHDEIERRLVALAPRALAVGVHLVVTALRWSELRPSFLDVVASRIELRLGDPFDSTVDRRAAATVPLARPGRGIVAGPHAMMLALPALVADQGATAGCTATVASIAEAWIGPAPQRWQDLPCEVAPAMLTARSPGHVRIGIDECGQTCEVPAVEHLVISGPDGSGRTTTLRAGLSEWIKETAGQVLLVDPRGSLGGAVDDAHLLAQIGGADGASPVLHSLADTLTRRLDGRAGPGPHVPVMVAVDDLDLARDLGIDLTALVPLLPRASSIGLRVVLACRGSSGRPNHRLTDLLVDLGAARIELSGDVPGRARLRVRGEPATLVQTAGPQHAPPPQGYPK